MLVFLLKWDKTIHKGMSLEGSKCIKNKTTRTFEYCREAWRGLVLQRDEDSSKPAIFWGEILISHAEKYKAFTN